MLYLSRFYSKNVVFNPKGVFSQQKKTPVGHTPGLNQRLYLPEMPTFEILIPNKHRICLNMLYLGRFCSTNVVVAQKVTFLRKKTAGRPHTGTQPKVIFTRNADFDAYCI